MQFPLQTRAAWLTPEDMRSTDQIERAIEEYKERSYNTIVVPALYEGDVLFDTNSSGDLKGRDCPGRHALNILAEEDLSVWVSVDILTAGSPGGRKLGTLARQNRHWLMKNVSGNLRPPQFPDIPALFCWTTEEYRRYLGNLAVDLCQAWPVDALVLDVRHLPRPETQRPETWMNAGFSCIQRMQRELGLDLEYYFSRPTLEDYERMEKWRQSELSLLVENVKARVQRFREGMPFLILGGIGSPEDPWAPWASWFDHGLIDEVLLTADGDDLPRKAEALDKLLSKPRPFVAAINTETSLGDINRSLEALAATGFAVLRPGPLQRVVMPDAPMTWETPGALESHPVAACAALLNALAEELKDIRSLGSFIRRVHEFLQTTGEQNVNYDDLMRIRKDLVRIQRKVREGGYDLGDEQDTILKRLELVTRLLLLAPTPTIEY